MDHHCNMIENHHLSEFVLLLHKLIFILVLRQSAANLINVPSLVDLVIAGQNIL